MGLTDNKVNRPYPRQEFAATVESNSQSIWSSTFRFETKLLDGLKADISISQQ
jgi:hypothetical protein